MSVFVGESMCFCSVIYILAYHGWVPTSPYIYLHSNNHSGGMSTSSWEGENKVKSVHPSRLVQENIAHLQIQTAKLCYVQ